MDSPGNGRGMRLEKAFGVSSLCISSFGDLVAFPVGCVAVLQTVSSGKQRAYMRVKKAISCLCFSSDGKYLAVGEKGHTPAITVWDVSSHQMLTELKYHSLGIQCMAFSPDSKLLVSVGFEHDDTLSLWHWETAEQLSKADLKSPVLGLDFAKDGSFLVTVGEKYAKFWMISEDNSLEKDWTAHSAGLMPDYQDATFTCVKCMGNGTTLISTLCGSLLSLGSNRLLEKWVFLEAAHCHSLTVKDEDQVLCGCSDGVIRLFHPCTLEFKATLPFPDPHLESFADALLVSWCENNLAVAMYSDKSLMVWDVSAVNDIRLHMRIEGHGSAVTGIDRAHGDASEFFTCCEDGFIRLWRFGGKKKKELARQVQIPSASEGRPVDPCCIAVSGDGLLVAVGCKDGRICVLDTENETWLNSNKGHESDVNCLSFSPVLSGENRLLVSGGRDRQILLFATSGEQVQHLQSMKEHSSVVTSIVFGKKGDKIISCGGDKIVVLLTVDEANTMTRQKSINCASQSVDVEASDKYFVTVGNDKQIRLWAIQNGKAIRSYKRSDASEMNRIKVDPGGMFCATSSASDKVVRMFDFYSGEPIGKGPGHSESVSDICFSDDCKRLVSVSRDGSMFVWRLAPEITTSIRGRMLEMQGPVFPTGELPVWARTKDVAEEIVITAEEEEDFVLESIDDEESTLLEKERAALKLKQERGDTDASVRKMRDKLKEIGILRATVKPGLGKIEEVEDMTPFKVPTREKSVAEQPIDENSNVAVAEKVPIVEKSEEENYESDFESDSNKNLNLDVSTLNTSKFVYVPGSTKLVSAEQARMACDTALLQVRNTLGSTVELFRQVEALDNNMLESINTQKKGQDRFAVEVLETSRSHVRDIMSEFKQQLSSIISHEMQSVDEITSARSGDAFLNRSMFLATPSTNNVDMQTMMSKLSEITEMLAKVVPS